MLPAQIKPGIYVTEVENVKHELKIDDNYAVYTAYKTKPAEFVTTLGGFAKTEITNESKRLIVLLEFNSDYTRDSVRQLSIPFEIKENKLHLKWFRKLTFEPIASKPQDLDGQWLFATRGPDEGQKRRGEANTRKTLKFLKEGRFQWIAYDTEGFQFKGTGGGSYTSQNGKYKEHIEFFSRDNNRVGAPLEFNYEVKGNDWHHTGKNSKGEPMYEIWSKRKQD